MTIIHLCYMAFQTLQPCLLGALQLCVSGKCATHNPLDTHTHSHHVAWRHAFYSVCSMFMINMCVASVHTTWQPSMVCGLLVTSEKILSHTYFYTEECVDSKDNKPNLCLHIAVPNFECLLQSEFLPLINLQLIKGTLEKHWECAQDRMERNESKGLCEEKEVTV